MKRTEYFGSADAKDLVSLEPYGCRRAMVLRKCEVAKDPVTPVGERFVREGEVISGPMMRGIELEPLILKRVQELSGCLIENTGQSQVGEVSHRLAKWLRATPDSTITRHGLEQQACLDELLPRGVTFPDALLALPGAVEAKSVDPAIFWDLRKKQAPRSDHVMQVYHQMAGTGAGWGLIVYQNPVSWETLWFLVERDMEWEEQSYLPACEEAWTEIQLAKEHIRPADSWEVWEEFLPDRLDAKSKSCKTCDWRRGCWGSEYSRIAGVAVEDAPTNHEGELDWIEATNDLKEAMEIHSAAEDLKKSAQKRVREIMGDEVAAEGNGVRIYLKPQTRKTLDSRKLREDHPELADEYTRESHSRPMRTYFV